ncbi:MAG: hypothetical protein P9F19_10990 [Candidatus Contendobacter sp.]|nr:hypothetical protein [Candidatus Contendobacter sp.]MDG4557893.1 hypothetical protein [Candidatus Contendobacter sp.]
MAKRKPEPVNKARLLTTNHDPCQLPDDHMAELALSPLVSNTTTALDFSMALFPDLSLDACVKVLKGNIQAINGGDLSGSEATLAAQATTLDTIFNNLARRAAHAEYMSQLEPYLRLALKAQAQCARTLEVLAALKNPPVIFAKQANIAHQQQVNNGAPTGPVSRAREVEKSPTQLLDVLPDERLESGTAGAASGAHSQLATVGTSNRPEDARG